MDITFSNIILVFTTLIGIIIYFVCKYLKMKREKDSLFKLCQEYKNYSESVDILSDILNVSYENNKISSSLQKLIDILIDRFNVSYVTFLMNNNESLIIKKSNISSPSSLAQLENFVNNIDKKISHLCGKQFYNVNGYFEYATDRKINYCFYIPIRCGDTTIGSLIVEEVDHNPDNSTLNLDFFKIALNSVMLEFKNIIYHDQIRIAAYTDTLTGLGNRRSMSEFYENYIETNSVFSLSIMDIDFFKKVNDTYGHTFGDEVLKIVSNFIKSKLPPESNIYRFGGEEFIIFIPADKFHTKIILNQIRGKIENLKIKYNNISTSITCSFGVSDTTDTNNNFDNLKEQADIALYEGKSAGRNIVVTYSENNRSKEISL